MPYIISDLFNPLNRQIYLSLNSLHANLLILFSDAEFSKNIPKYLICGDFAGDFAEVVGAFADVLG